MITVERRVTVNEDRTIQVTLPSQVPVGDAEILIVVHPDSVLPVEAGKTLWDFYGILGDSPSFNEDPVAIQRRLRDEWDPHLPA